VTSRFFHILILDNLFNLKFHSQMGVLVYIEAVCNVTLRIFKKLFFNFRTFHESVSFILKLGDFLANNTALNLKFIIKMRCFPWR